MKAWAKGFSAAAFFLLGGCATAPALLPSAPTCYRPHWAIPFDLDKIQAVARRTFTLHTGSERHLTIFSPGPFDRSFFFVMSPHPGAESVAASPHIGVLLDSDQNGAPECIILAGGTLPDAKGRPVPYNFFAIDRGGAGDVDEFISEDLDLDGDRVMDRDVQAILIEPDAEGRFQRGAYLKAGRIQPIPK
ncbi:MAG TPA: hypothetical protein VI702_03760, partial [Nitrospiria bacterium]